MYEIPQRGRLGRYYPWIANIFDSHSESLLFQRRHSFPWVQFLGSMLEFMTAIVFVFYVDRWITGRNYAPVTEEEQFGPTDEPVEGPIHPPEEDYEPIVPRLYSAPEAPSRKSASSRDQEPLPTQAEN